MQNLAWKRIVNCQVSPREPDIGITHTDQSLCHPLGASRLHGESFGSQGSAQR